MTGRLLAAVAAAAIVSVGVAAQAPAADPIDQLTPVDEASLGEVRAGAGFSGWSSWGSLSNLLVPAHEGLASAKSSAHQGVSFAIYEVKSGITRISQRLSGYPYPHILPPTGL